MSQGESLERRTPGLGLDQVRSSRAAYRPNPDAGCRDVLPGSFSEVGFISAAPCGGVDFLSDALVNEYHRFPLIEMLPITREETYWLRGDNR